MPALTLDVHPSLRPLLPPGRRAAPFAVDAGPTETFGHLVQAAGIPLTEVGDLLLDGHRRAASARATTGTLTVRPITRPQETSAWPPRFLLDVHLAGLARRLRLLGLDAAGGADVPDPGDAALVERANAERRVLLTSDRRLLHRRSLAEGALVPGIGSAEQMRDVLDRFAPPLAPWTRCLRCGALLRAVRRDDVVGHVEPGTLRTYTDFSRCSRCGQVFWRGAHGDRLAAVVAEAETVVARRRGPGSVGRPQPTR